MIQQNKTDPPPRPGDPSSKGAGREPPRLTVMIVGKVGRIRSFRISGWTISLAALFLCAFIPASVVVFNEYFEGLRQKEALREEIVQLKKAVKEKNLALQRSRQYALLLEEAHKDRSGAEKQKGGEPPSADSEKPAPVREDKVAREISDAVDQPPEPQVAVEGLELRRKGSTVRVHFKLLNRAEDGGAVSGYTHMIAVDQTSNPPQFWTYPKAAVKEGVPVNYRRGQRFKIKRFKVVEGEYFLDPERPFPSSLKVIVYDESGALLLEKQFEVDPDDLQDRENS